MNYYSLSFAWSKGLVIQPHTVRSMLIRSMKCVAPHSAIDLLSQQMASFIALSAIACVPAMHLNLLIAFRRPSASHCRAPSRQKKKTYQLCPLHMTGWVIVLHEP